MSFSERAGNLQCYTDKLDALRNWREYFFWIDRDVFPFNFEFYTQGSFRKDERPVDGSFSAEDAEVINENRIAIRAYPKEFLVHMGISRNFFQPETEMPIFLYEDGRGGCSSFLLLLW